MASAVPLSVSLLLGLAILPLATAQIYLPCDVTEFTSKEGCTCWNQQNPIIKCSSLGLKRIPKLEKARMLDLSNNSITYISESSFKRLFGLRLLNLSHNRINSLHFRSLHNEVGAGLNILDLDHNRLEKVPAIFGGRVIGYHGMTTANLTVLRLSHNFIGAVDSYTFRGSPSLRRLYLDGNPILRIELRSWWGLHNLRHLALGIVGMEIPTIPTEHIVDLTSLRLVGARPRRLDILRLWFENFPSLERLALEAMGLRDGHFCKGAFPTTWGRSLRGISFSDNELTAVPFHVLDLPLLRHLDVSRNWIVRVPAPLLLLPPPMLTRTTSLTPLTPLTPLLQRILAQLLTFDLSDNVIEHLDAGLLLSLRRARVIDVSDNRLSVLPLTLRQLRRNLRPDAVLRLGGNPWACDRCANKWLIQLLGTPYLSEEEDALSDFRCGPTGSNSGDLIKDLPARRPCTP